MTFSLDGQFLASASNDGTVRLWDTASYHQVAILPHQHPVLSVAVSPDGTLLASTRKKSVLLWAIPAQQEVGRLEGHIATVNDIAFSPDGIRLVSGSNDTTVRTGDVSTGEEIGRLVHLAKLLFSVNARIVGDLMPDSDLPDALRREFENNGVFLPETATVHFEPLSRDPESEPFWWVADDEGFYTILQEKDTLSLFSTPVKILLDRFNTGSSFLNAIIFGSKTAIYGYLRLFWVQKRSQTQYSKLLKTGLVSIVVIRGG